MESDATTATLKIYVWILSGTLGFMITVFLMIVQNMATKLGKKFDGLLESVQTLTSNSIQQTEQIKTLFTEYTETTRRLNNHTDRIRDIELQCAKCKRT